PPRLPGQLRGQGALGPHPPGWLLEDRRRAGARHRRDRRGRARPGAAAARERERALDLDRQGAERGNARPARHLRRDQEAVAPRDQDLRAPDGRSRVEFRMNASSDETWTKAARSGFRIPNAASRTPTPSTTSVP